MRNVSKIKAKVEHSFEYKAMEMLVNVTNCYGIDVPSAESKGLAKQQIAVAWHSRDKKNGDSQWLCFAKQRLSYKQASNGEAFLGKVMICEGGEKNRFAKEQQGSEQQNDDLQRISKVMIC